MKIPTPARKFARGIMILETIVYMGIFALLTGLALSAFYHFQSQSDYLRRNCDDIARTLGVGERWREDVRNSLDTKLIENDQEVVLRLSHRDGEVLYSFHEGNVWRKKLPGGRWIPALKMVKSSEFRSLPAGSGRSWVWELELVAAQKTVRLKPLFSFMATTRKKEEP
jgi:hypothetical protein